LDAFREHGEPAKQVIKIGAGPDGKTIKAPDSETIAEYMAAKKGFVTFIEDGRIWVFRPDSEDLTD